MSEDAHDLVCSNCGKARDTRGWYCRACRRAYMQAWRAKEQRELRKLRAITKGLLRESMEPIAKPVAVTVRSASTG
jgi:tRNA(Ile2) C34 agmatinyltransferase TiaS